MIEPITTNNFTSWFIYVLPYVLVGIFALAIVFRVLVYYTVRRHEWFAQEFEKRVNRFMDNETPGDVKNVSFYVLSKKLLENTYYEVFEMRDRVLRRKYDNIMRLSDRIFLIKPGCAWLVRDILKQLKFLKWTNDTPKMINITKSTFNQNPCFNQVFGLIPIGTLNDLLSILPGLFVVAGILGTFLGIRGGLSSLGTMSLEDLEATKKVMDHFLGEIAYAMGSSIVGIALSLSMHIWNTIFSPEKSFFSMINRFEAALDLLWYRSDSNTYPEQSTAFDENRDPLEALAAESINAQIARSQTLEGSLKI